MSNLNVCSRSLLKQLVKEESESIHLPASHPQGHGEGDQAIMGTVLNPDFTFFSVVFYPTCGQADLFLQCIKYMKQSKNKVIAGKG